MSTPTKPSKRERREARRDEDRRRRADEARRARTTRLLTFGAIALLVVAAIALAAGPLYSLLGAGGARAQGTQFPGQGQEHIDRGQTHAAYNSNPPTSGPHERDPARWGVHEQPLPDEQLVHNLEHGGIVIHYNCPDGCPELVGQLRDLASGYRSKVLLAPRPDPGVTCRITLTAWTWLDCFDAFDAERINAFIRAHKDRGPELLPD